MFICNVIFKDETGKIEEKIRGIPLDIGLKLKIVPDS